MGKEAITTSVEHDTAVLVGVNGDITELDELAALCESCNILTAARVTQNVREIDVAYYIGSGKVQEVKEIVNTSNATVVVFDVELSGSKVRNLEEILNVPVLDRSKIILDIFAQRAQSAEGKLQVELAQLKYNLPRLIGSAGVMAKMKTSVGMRGPGEKKLELDKRKIRDDVLFLEKKLAKLCETRELSNRAANKSGKPRVCIVGYTNSGKSTLLNTIAKTDTLAQDKLFATLDPKTANVFIDGTQILLTDTVGFIERLPHEFISAFQSTLDSVRYADLLLHVVDISNPNYARQISAVADVLKSIGAGEIPMILVFNKIDNIAGGLGGVTPPMPKVEYHGMAVHGEIAISAKKNENIDLLKKQIVNIIGHESNGLRRNE
jgi:GTP-binding protein HflX